MYHTGFYIGLKVDMIICSRYVTYRIKFSNNKFKLLLEKNRWVDK